MCLKKVDDNIELGGVGKCESWLSQPNRRVFCRSLEEI